MVSFRLITLLCKSFLVITSVLTIISVAASRGNKKSLELYRNVLNKFETSETEYYRDERGKTYVIGTYGERIYEDADGNMIEKNKKKIEVTVDHDVI